MGLSEYKFCDAAAADDDDDYDDVDVLTMIVYDRQVSSQFWLSLLHYGTVIADYHCS